MTYWVTNGTADGHLSRPVRPEERGHPSIRSAVPASCSISRRLSKRIWTNSRASCRASTLRGAGYDVALGRRSDPDQKLERNRNRQPLENRSDHLGRLGAGKQQPSLRDEGR